MAISDTNWRTSTAYNPKDTISDFTDNDELVYHFDPIETEWASAKGDIHKKRRRFLGRKDSENPEYEAKAFFKLLKKDLKKKELKKFKKLANKAFEEALKFEELGQERVKKKLEERMSLYLKKAAIETKEYNRYVDEDMIEKYRDHLPETKALVIDDIEEYENPIPKDIQKKLTKAKKAKIFDSFSIFWIKDVPDPILFGQIEEDKDAFYYIGEWDNDISIDDLLKYKE